LKSKVYMNTINIKRTINNITYIDIHNIHIEWRSVYRTLLSLIWMLTHTHYFIYNEIILSEIYIA